VEFPLRSVSDPENLWLFTGSAPDFWRLPASSAARTAAAALLDTGRIVCRTTDQRQDRGAWGVSDGNDMLADKRFAIEAMAIESYNVAPPVISIINQSYWSYVHQLNAILGASHCRNSWSTNEKWWIFPVCWLPSPRENHGTIHADFQLVEKSIHGCCSTVTFSLSQWEI